LLCINVVRLGYNNNNFNWNQDYGACSIQ
jgi:hypothetical protein